MSGRGTTMLKRTSHHLALAIAVLALFLAMGGPAWAAGKINGADIKKSTVTGKQVKDSSLAGADLKNSSLTGADLKSGSVGRTDLAPGSVTTSRFAASAVAPSASSVPGLLPGDFSAASGTPSTAGPFSLAAGRRAKATNAGSFVWADSTDADFTSTADDQFAIRAANGMVIANNAGTAATVPVGTRFRDNAVVAWARVTSNGTLDNNFNVGSVTRVALGHYKVTLNTSLQSGFSLIPVVTPEVDEAAGNVPPVGAANVRFAVTNQFAAGNNFDVYIYNGSFASVDNDFQVLVTGR